MPVQLPSWTSGDLGLLQQYIESIAIISVISSMCVMLKIIATALQLQRDDNPKRKALVWSMALAIAGLAVLIPTWVFQILQGKTVVKMYENQDLVNSDHGYALALWTAYGIDILYPLACALPKLSICFLYLRLFDINIWARRTAKALIVFLITNAIAWLIPSIVVCYPISSYLDPEASGQHCFDRGIFGGWISVPQIATDLIILILPFLMIWRRQMSATKKLGSVLVLFTGSFGLVAACIRLAIYVNDGSYANGLNASGDEVSLRSITLSNLFFTIEPSTYLIAVCLPTTPIVYRKAREILRPLEKRIQEHLNPLKTGLRKFHKRFQKASHEHEPTEGHEGNGIGSRVNIKLTGMGNLESLARETEAIGRTGARVV